MSQGSVTELLYFPFNASNYSACPFIVKYRTKRIGNVPTCIMCFVCQRIITIIIDHYFGTIPYFMTTTCVTCIINSPVLLTSLTLYLHFHARW